RRGPGPRLRHAALSRPAAGAARRAARPAAARFTPARTAPDRPLPARVHACRAPRDRRPRGTLQRATRLRLGEGPRERGAAQLPAQSHGVERAGPAPGNGTLLPPAMVDRRAARALSGPLRGGAGGRQYAAAADAARQPAPYDAGRLSAITRRRRDPRRGHRRLGG